MEDRMISLNRADAVIEVPSAESTKLKGSLSEVRSR